VSLNMRRTRLTALCACTSLAIYAAGLLTGCANSSTTSGLEASSAIAYPAPSALGNNGSTTEPTTKDNGQVNGQANPHADIATELERRMMIGPAAARSIGWRPTWTLSFEVDGGIQRIWSNDSGVFVLDGRNELSLLSTDTGLRRWRTFIGEPGDIILDLFVSTEAQLVIILRSDALVTCNLATGFPEGPLDGVVPPVQRLEWLARTGGKLIGEDLIYGGLGGEVVWQSWSRGFSSRAHRVGRRLNVPPVIFDDTLIASALGGQVVALQTATGGLIWSRTLLDGLGAAPTRQDDRVYLAGLDQHLRCVSLETGRAIWTVLLTAPLKTSPVVLGDSVYQLIPDEGLSAWETTPKDSPEGRQRWISNDVHGSVISTLGDRLLTWNPRAGVLATASPMTGALDVSLQLEPGTRVQASDMDNGRLFVISATGRVESLLPAR